MNGLERLLQSRKLGVVNILQWDFRSLLAVKPDAGFLTARKESSLNQMKVTSRHFDTARLGRSSRNIARQLGVQVA